MERERPKKGSSWRSRKVVRGLLGPLVLLAVLPAPASAYPRPGTTQRVSVASDGTQADQSSATFSQTSISADGRYVAFSTHASNLVPGDTNGADDVFVHDRKTGITERVSVASDGTEGDDSSDWPSISADGRYVAFTSAATNLVPGDANESADVFVHDREAGVTERVSVANHGPEGNDASGTGSISAISADGRYVAFHSSATNLVLDDTNAADDVFVHDREARSTERVSVTSGGGQGNGDSHYPSISADGRYVAFESTATNFVDGDSVAYDVFVHSRETGVTEKVSVSSSGARGDDGAIWASISADGRYVAFHSGATNFVPGDINGISDVFVHDRETGETERVSVASDGTEGNAPSHSPSISADGRLVAFDSMASNLTGTEGPWGDVYVHDRETRTTERVSVAGDGAVGDQGSLWPSMSADGRFVSFIGWATNLVPGDTNGREDVFVRDRGPAVGMGDMTVAPQGDAVSVSGWATFSGAVVASASDPPGDGHPAAEAAGAELTGASLTYRHEEEDLLVRLGVTSLPRSVGWPANSEAGAPTVVYGLGFRLAGASYEVRGLRASPMAAPSASPHFALYECEVVCLESARLSGGIGTTGREVVVSVPMSALGAAEGAAITDVRAFTALGEAASGGVVTLDEVGLPAATIPIAHVSLGVAPADASEHDVAFDVEADLTDGAFAGIVDAPAFAGGHQRVWSRVCLGEVCGPAQWR